MPLRVSRLVVVGVAGLTLACGGCSASSSAPGSSATDTGQRATPAGRGKAPVWSPPSNPLDRAVAAGLEPAVKEHLAFHVHAHLDVFVDGKPVIVPAGIGINTKDPEVIEFPEADGSTGYGGIEQCDTPCISPLHTHDATGILHTESQVLKPNLLGEFFTEWGVRFTDSCIAGYCSPEQPIAFYVDGKRYAGDPHDIELTDLEEIAVVIGTPPAEVPSTADFSQA